MEPTNTDVPPKPSIRPPAPKLAGENDFPLSRLRGIQFGLLSRKEVIALSVIDEKDASNHRVGITKWQDLFDARLGVPNKENKCKTCNGTRRGAFDRPDSCDGHFGHIALPAPIYHPHFIRKCHKILSSICLGCSRVLEKKKRKNILEDIFEEESCDEDDDSENSALEKPARKRKAVAVASRKWKRAEKSKDFEFAKFMQGLEGGEMKQEWEPSFALDSSNRGFPQVCKMEPTEISDAALPGHLPNTALPGHLPENAGQTLVCNYCGGPDGAGSKFPKVKLKLVSKIVQKKGKVETIKLVVDEKAGDLPPGFWDFVRGHPYDPQEKTRTLLPVEADKILRRIPVDDIEKLHMDVRVACPDAFVIVRILVPPNCNRLVMEDWSSTFQPRVLMRRSGQTNKLEALVRNAKQIRDVSGATVYTGIDFGDSERDSEALQMLAARHFRACKVVEYKMMTGKEVEESGGTLELKWLKANILGKRSNYTARSVINGDPWIRIEEIGIPKEIAQRLTVEEKVNTLNIRRWQKFVNDYMVSNNVSMPGVLILRKKKDTFERDLRLLRTKTEKSSIKLGLGDTINRSLQDGDLVFANRPPTLHKHSLIALKVKVHSLSTIAINPLICPPFDGDFDGDTFHIFVPQSLETKAETQELMTIPAQMISSQGGQPIIGLTQDVLVAAHLLTSDHVFINRTDMGQLSMWCTSGLPFPAIVKAPARTGPLWTGKQLFSMTLPGELSFGSLSWTGTRLGETIPPKHIQGAQEDVLIQDGEVLICQGGVKWLERSPTGVLRAICNQAGPVAAMEHLDCLQAVLHQWLLIRGFSVGMHDFYVAEDAGARKRMLNGVQKSLEKSNEASLKQALRLDRQVQHRVLFPMQSEQAGSAGGVDGVEEHQGCFGLLLDDRKSTQRVTALQVAAIERFQTLSPDIENLVSGYMDKKNSLLAMVRSGSKGSMSKITQQVGCLGLQLNKGERMLPIRRNNKLSYFLTSLENGKSDVFYQTRVDAALEGYWESRGIIRSSLLDGLNARELFMDNISSRFNVLRQGIEEPNLILKNLMLFMRDMKIEYDGTVRVGSGRSIIQFQYGTGKGSVHDIDPNRPAPSCILSNTSLVAEAPEDLWPDSKLAGEPVGVLAATSISEPAYDVRMQSIHQAQVLGTGPVQLLKEILMVRSKTKLKLNDRRSILRLHQGFGKERRALEIQRQLQEITLEKITLACAIEYRKLDHMWYVKEEIDKPFLRMSKWMGHIELCKKTVNDNKFNAALIVQILNKKHSGKATEDLHGIYFSYSDNCMSRAHPHKGLCIWFFPVISPETLATMNGELSPEKMAVLLESMKTTMVPAILNTTIRGSDNIEKVRIFWEDSGSASRVPQERISIGGPHTIYQARRADRGELAIEVVVKAPKGAGKRGYAWEAVKEACVPVIDMIDWRRSTPYAIQEIYKGYGVEAARHLILKRLTLASQNMGKPIHQEHLMLVADTMTHCGEVTGLGSAGYRDFCSHLSISAPFTEAAFQQPKKTFLDAAAGGASESIDGVLTAAVWGSRAPLGTGIAFQMKPKVPKISCQGDPLDLWEELREPKAEGRTISAHQKVSYFESSLFRKGKQTERVLEMLEKFEDLTGTKIFSDGKLAGVMLGKGKDFRRATIFQYNNEEGCNEDMPENVVDVITEPNIQNTFLDDKQTDDDRIPEKVEDTNIAPSLQDDKHEGRNGAVERVKDVMGAPAVEGDTRTGLKRVLERSEERAELADEPLCKFQKKHATPSEGEIANLRVNDPRQVTLSGCDDGEALAAADQKIDCIYDRYKLPNFSSEEVSQENITLNVTPSEGEIANLRVNDPRQVTLSGCDDGEALAAADQKIDCIYDRYKLPNFSSEEVSQENITLNATPSEGEIANLRVNHPRQVTLSGCDDGEALAAADQKIDCIYDHYKLPNFSSEEVSQENITPTTDEVSEETAAPASVKAATSTLAGRVSQTSTDVNKREGGIWTWVRSMFSPSPGKNDQATHEQELEGLPGASDLGNGDPEIRGGISQSRRGVSHESSDQQKRLSPVRNGSSIGPVQSELVANKEYEQLITNQKTELHNLLHFRYRVGERVQEDVQKMILDEVLVHHPSRDAKIGCGVDYVKVDYHPDHSTSKCFHIVRKDGSWTDFSYHKCLDRKLLKLCNSKQK